MSHGMKIGNEYARALGRMYAKTPKAVFAAIAFSYADRLFAKTSGTESADVLLEEWRILYENGIVTQKPIKLP
jgi:hypothetical protein